MSGRDPDQIWEASVEEGRRRLARTTPAMVATGFVGGIDVMLGIVALTVTSGALQIVMPEAPAHTLASLTFGIAFVLIVIGRSELFTENFLVPVVAVTRRAASTGRLFRLWTATFVGNLIALLILALTLTRAGLVPPETLDAASSIAETFAERDWVAALLSAMVAGAVMTLLTWLAHATDDAVAKILVALAIGFLLAAPSLNHAVVGFGEMAFGILADRGEATWTDLVQNLPLAIAGNLVGGLLLVTATRLVQVRGEPA